MLVYFGKSLSIFDWLSDGNPENDIGLSDSKMGGLGHPELPLFRALYSETVTNDLVFGIIFSELPSLYSSGIAWCAYVQF